MNDIHVLVAGSGNVTGINIIRALVGNVPKVIGCDCKDENPANKFCKNYHIPKAAESNYINSIKSLIINHNITHIIASNDHDVRSLSTHINELREKNILFNGFSRNTLNWLDKAETAYLFQQSGILTPEEIYSVYDFPYVLRKKRMGDDQKFVHVVRSENDLVNIEIKNSQEAMMTRYIEGEEYTIDILCDQNSKVLSIVPRLRRLVEHGMVHFAEIIHDPILMAKVKEIAMKVQLKGINCLQCIKNESNYYFIEINPRPGSGIDLTINSGVNMPLIWVNLSEEIKGTNIPEPDWGLKMLRYYDGYYYK